MRIEHLSYLMEIRHRKSMSTAARHLGLTQQALSSCIKSMEKELGATLLVRTKQGSTLTEAGKKVLAAAETIVPCYARLRDTLNQKDEKKQRSRLEGELRIYTNSPFYLSSNPDILKNFCEEHPFVHISITELPQKTIFEKLMQSGVNDADQIAIINVPLNADGTPAKDFLPPSPKLRFRPIVKGGYLACVSRLSPLAHSKRLSLRTLLKYPIVMGASEEMSLMTPLHYLLRQHGSPRFMASVATLGLWNMVIANNSGIGFIHDALIRKNDVLPTHFQDLVFIRIREPLLAVTGYVLPLFPGKITQEMSGYMPREQSGPSCHISPGD